METQARKSPHTLFWIAGIAVTLFSVAGIAAIMGWIPASTGGSGENIGQAKPPAAQAKPAAANAYKAPAQPPVQVATNAPARARCAECGVIESVREIDTKGAGSGIGVVGAHKHPVAGEPDHLVRDRIEKGREAMLALAIEADQEGNGDGGWGEVEDGHEDRPHVVGDADQPSEDVDGDGRDVDGPGDEDRQELAA